MFSTPSISLCPSFPSFFYFFQTTNYCLVSHIERLDGYKAFHKHKVYMMINHTGISGFSLLLELAWKPLMEVCFQNPSLEHINANPPHTCITGSINGFTGCGRDKIGCRQREERARYVKRLSFHFYLHLIISDIVYRIFHLIADWWFSITRQVFLSSASSHHKRTVTFCNNNNWGQESSLTPGSINELSAISHHYYSQ